MLPEVGGMVVQYIERLRRYYGHPINVNLHGGEPFHAFPIMQRIVESSTARFTVFTNGATAARDQVNWCRVNHIGVQRSTAGCSEAAALTRPGDYTARWLERGAWWRDYGYSHRLTVTPATAPFVCESVRWLREHGYYGPVDLATDDYTPWPVEAQHEYEQQLDQLAEIVIAHAYADRWVATETFQNFGRAIFGQPNITVMGCGAGWETVGISVDGFVSPCHRFMRDKTLPRIALADILAGKERRFGKAFDGWFTDICEQKERSECLSCEARQSCPRGCPHVSYATAGNFTTQPPHRCRFIRAYRRAAMKIDAALKDRLPRWWENKPTPDTDS
jgi:radical SAM protein with 4Fe4S-binding SPASM domain